MSKVAFNRVLRALASVWIAALFSSVAFSQGVSSIYSATSGPTLPSERGIESENYLAPTDFLLDASGDNFYVASEGLSQLRRVPTDGTTRAEGLDLSFKPFKLRFFPDETRVAAVGGLGEGKLAIVEVAKKADDGAISPVPMKLIAERVVGHSPADVCVKGTEDGKELVYVADRFADKVREIDAATGEELRAWETNREPFCMELTPDGKRLVVADRLTKMQANVSKSYAKVYIVELETGELKTVDLLNGNNALQDMALTPDGKFAFVSALLCSYSAITSQVSGGWIGENGLVCVDVENAQLVEVFFLDDAQLGAGNPWGVACSEDGKNLIVSLAGTDEIVFMPLEGVREIIAKRPSWARPGYGAYSYQSFAKGDVQFPLRVRVKFGFKGLRQLIARGDDVYALSYFDDVLCKATLKRNPPYKFFPDSYVAAEKPPRTAPGAEDADAEAASYAELCADLPDDPTVGAPLRFTKLETKLPLEGVEIERSFARLAPKPVLTTRRRGEIIFHDATACFEHWLSCVTCHPDARADGFNWDLLNDGTGNLKNAKSMLLSHETPPCMISGIRADAETAVRAGFTHILFMPYKEENASCVDDYLQALEPVPSPRLVNGELSESAKRGKGVFQRIGCATCHLGDYYTDLRLHDVDSKAPNDSIREFDTPTLIEVWRTAPYLNTGEYLTIRELLEKGKHGVKDGQFDELSKEEQDDLIEFVSSL
ncbi:MAG: hypothetical protein IJM30_12090 [Thermoguttaceae bacterium]|nr:hypothetical protein [Thermoguttaceae bacterium]